MSQPLIIIDVQEEFISRNASSHFDDIIDNVAEQCIRAMERDEHIIFVEFDSRNSYLVPVYGKKPIEYGTIDELVELTKLHKKRFFVRKTDCDGGEEIVELLNDKRIAHSSLRVCGVYTDACVHMTVRTLTDLLPRTPIKVVRNATAMYFNEPTLARAAFRDISQIPRVQPIGRHVWT